MTNGKKNVEKVQIVQIIEDIFLDIHVRSGRGNTVLLIYMQTYPTRLLCVHSQKKARSLKFRI